MAEDKPFDATPSRKRQARKEGNVARSTELTGLATLAAGLATAGGVASFGPALLGSVLSEAAYGRVATGALVSIAVLAFVPALVSLITGVTVTFMQSSGPTSAPLKLEFKRLAPADNVKTMFGPEAAVNALRASLALLAGGAVIWNSLQHLFARGIGEPLGADVAIALEQTRAAANSILAVGVAFAIADVFLSRRRWAKKLKMSHDELKRDTKEQNGDPYIKGRRRVFARALAMAPVERTAGASFVVTNPTHLAIALRYDPPAVDPPRVLVRAADERAAAVRAIADAHGVPIIENVAVARALYRVTEPGDDIPEDLFSAIAEIVAELIGKGTLRCSKT